MVDYLRPLSNLFMLNEKPMPKPHSFKTKRKTPNKDASRCVNTGVLICTPMDIIIVETTWEYKLIRDDQYNIIFNEVFNGIENFSNKKFITLNSDNLNKVYEYETYEPDNFEGGTVTAIQKDSHRYYKNVKFTFTSVGQVVEKDIVIKGGET